MPWRIEGMVDDCSEVCSCGMCWTTPRFPQQSEEQARPRSAPVCAAARALERPSNFRCSLPKPRQGNVETHSAQTVWKLEGISVSELFGPQPGNKIPDNGHVRRDSGAAAWKHVGLLPAGAFHCEHQHGIKTECREAQHELTCSSGGNRERDSAQSGSSPSKTNLNLIFTDRPQQGCATGTATTCSSTPKALTTSTAVPGTTSTTISSESKLLNKNLRRKLPRGRRTRAASLSSSSSSSSS